MSRAVTKHDFNTFKSLIWDYYNNNRRAFPWRDEISPYRVFISEIMLQQTQAKRVVEKFEAFIKFLPDFQSLAQASFYDVLKLWKGLGYNRRALALQKSAQIIIAEYEGLLPEEPALLQKLPGIGKATAGSISAFAFNRPTIFLETNIRTVFIHFFFNDRLLVLDKEIESLLEKTVNQECARDWYYALMDYGVMLKKSIGNESRKSAHYTKQSKFKGSDREIRGLVLQALLESPSLSKEQLISVVDKEASRLHKVISELCAEGLIEASGDKLIIRQ